MRRTERLQPGDGRERDMKTYTISSVKGSKTVRGTAEEAIAAAVEMERELRPAFGVTVELDGATVATVLDGAVERDDEEPAETETKQTLAEQASAAMGDDGSHSTAPDGRSLQQVCRSMGAEVWRRESGDRRYEFRDGSAIVVLSGTWDLKHPDCDCGWCWSETDAESLCTSSQYATREWMLTSDTLDAEDAADAE